MDGRIRSRRWTAFEPAATASAARTSHTAAEPTTRDVEMLGAAVPL
jgi:hypothetical protein